MKNNTKSVNEEMKLPNQSDQMNTEKDLSNQGENKPQLNNFISNWQNKIEGEDNRSHSFGKLQNTN